VRLDKANFDLIEAIEAYAAERDRSMLQIAIGGLAAMPTVGSVIAGATSAEQVVENASAGLWVPSGDDLEALLEITKPAI
jgi:aryl-alcohol dehydrogenase-like predicted oxidoreductase